MIIQRPYTHLSLFVCDLLFEPNKTIHVGFPPLKVQIVKKNGSARTRRSTSSEELKAVYHYDHCVCICVCVRAHDINCLQTCALDIVYMVCDYHTEKVIELRKINFCTIRSLVIWKRDLSDLASGIKRTHVCVHVYYTCVSSFVEFEYKHHHH